MAVVPFNPNQKNNDVTTSQPPVETGKTQDKQIGLPVETLSSSFEVQKPVVNRSYSAKLPPKSNPLKRFFHKYTDSLTEADKQEVKSTKEIMKFLGDTLKGIKEVDHQIQLQERKIQGKDASEETLKVIADNIEKSTYLLKLAEGYLDQLQIHKGAVTQLAEKYASVSSIPYDIQDLENEAAHLKSRVEALNEIESFEEVLVNYNENKTWDQFERIGAQSKTFTEEFINLIRNDPHLNNSKQIQELLQQSDEKLLQNAYNLIKLAHPSLVVHIDRLRNNYLKIQEKRVENLEKKAEIVKNTAEIYHKNAFKISKLEERLYSPKPLNRIRQIVDKLFGLRIGVKKDLDEAEIALKKNFAALQGEGMFNPEELKWLNAVAKKNKNLASLSESVAYLQNVMSHISAREETGDRMTDLFYDLKTYQYHKNLIKHEQASQRPSRRKKNLEKVSADQVTEKMMRNLHQEIQDQIRDIALQMKSRREMDPDIYKPLPDDFSALAPIDQFQAYAAATFPKLAQRAENIIEIIKSQGLVKESEALIRDAWKRNTTEQNFDVLEISQEAPEIEIPQEKLNTVKETVLESPPENFSIEKDVETAPAQHEEEVKSTGLADDQAEKTTPNEEPSPTQSGQVPTSPKSPPPLPERKVVNQTPTAKDNSLIPFLDQLANKKVALKPFNATLHQSDKEKGKPNTENNETDLFNILKKGFKEKFGSSEENYDDDLFG